MYYKRKGIDCSDILIKVWFYLWVDNFVCNVLWSVLNPFFWDFKAHELIPMNLAGDSEKAFVFKEFERNNMFLGTVAKLQILLSYKYFLISNILKRRNEKRGRGAGNVCYFIFWPCTCSKEVVLFWIQATYRTRAWSGSDHLYLCPSKRWM